MTNPLYLRNQIKLKRSAGFLKNFWDPSESFLQCVA